MTRQKHLKRRVRDRMLKTGESYASARRIVLSQSAEDTGRSPHLAGNVPAATALRVLLTQRGLRDPHTGRPLTEAMVFGIAGGIGAGVFAFRYEKEDFSSFFIAGRHRWDDDLSYLDRAIARFGGSADIRESTGAKKAARQLRELLDGGRPVIAWVDAGSLPYRAMPAQWSGGGYHLLVVYAADEAAGVAQVGDLADAPIELGLPELNAARGRIKKDEYRLLALAEAGESFELPEAVLDGLRACHGGLTAGRSSNFTLEGFRIWSEQLVAPGKQGWRAKFAPGPNLWRGLTSIYDFIEHYGTGGGLCRPLFAEFLLEASEALDRPDLADLAGEYSDIGHAWSALAEAALPNEVEAFRQAKQLMSRKAELFLSEGASGRESFQATWRELGRLADQAAEEFPIPPASLHGLLEELSARVAELYRREVQACAALRAAAGH